MAIAAITGNQQIFKKKKKSLDQPSISNDATIEKNNF